MKVVRCLLAESRFLFVAGVLASVVSGTATMGVLIVLFHIIGGTRSADIKWWQFAALGIVAVAARAVSRRIIGHLGREALLRIRVTLSRQIAESPLVDLEQTGSSRLLAALTDDIGRISRVLPNLVLLSTNITLFVACIVYLGWLSPIHLLGVGVIIAIGAAAHLLLRREGTRQARISRDKWQEMLDSFRALVDGAKEIKLNAARGEQALETFSRRASDLKDSGQRQSRFFGASATLTQLLFYVAIGVALVEFAETRTNRLVIVGYVVSIIYLMGPLQNIIEILQSFVRANIALGRIEELGLRLDQARLHEPAGSAALSPNHRTGWETLQLAAIRYAYGSQKEKKEQKEEDHAFALGPIDLTLTAGEILFVVGGNGSGKTTFGKVLTGLYAPTSGDILVDGRCLDEADRAWYRAQFAAVFDGFFLFERLLTPDGEDSSRDAEATALLQRLQIADRITIENGRLSRTTALSLGERKRVALMLACLDDRPIYLFDEWAADQDPAFKDIFYREILGELRRRGKLVIVISHDDRYFDAADKFLVLERGLPPVVKPAAPARETVDISRTVTAAPEPAMALSGWRAADDAA